MFKLMSFLAFLNGSMFRFNLTPEEQIAAGLAEAAAKKTADEAAAKLAADEAAAKKAADEAAAKKLADDEAARKAKGGPTDAEAKLLKEVMEKKAALKAAEDARKAAEDKLKEFDGVDLAEIRKLAAEKKAAEEASLVAKGDWERLKTQMAEAHSKETTTIRTQLDAEKAEKAKLISTIGELTVGSAFVGSKFVTEGLTLTPSKARVIYGSHFEYKDGQVVGYNKPAGAAERTMLVDGQGNALPFDAAITKIVDTDPDRDELLRSKAKPGANSRSNATPGNTETKLPPETSGLSKIAAGLAKGIGK
jgi:hypothetical protein